MNFSQFIEPLKNYEHSRIVFVGLGNEARGDDAAGIIFIDFLKRKSVFASAKFINAGTNPENYLQLILNYNPKLVVFIDAADWHGTPGDIKWLNPGEIEQMDISTHNFSVKLIELYISSYQRIDFLYLGIQHFSLKYGKAVSKQLQLGLDNFFNQVS